MLTQARLRDLLEYDPQTGLWRWRKLSHGNRKPGWFGGAAGTNGYLTIRVDDVTHNAHVLAWLYTYGAMPASLLDHRDRVKSNNKLSNLRLTDRSANVINSKTREDNKSGHPGIWYNASRSTWFAYINKAPRGRLSKSFKTFEEALAWRMMMEKRLYGEYVPAD